MSFRMEIWICLAGVLLLASADAQTPLEIGIRQVQEGNCAGAVQTLLPLTKATPKPNQIAYLVISDCQVRTNQPDAGVNTLREGLRIYPASGELQRSLGELLFHQKSGSAEAGELLRKSTIALPQDPESRHFYAQWAFLNFRERICVDQEKAALKLPGLNDVALFQMQTLLALCAEKIEDTVLAKQSFQAANAINLRQPNYDPVAAWQYVRFSARFNTEDEVEAVVEQILERVPRFGPALLERAKHLDRMQEPQKAIEAAQLALKGLGNDINIERAAHNILAKSYFVLGQTEDAEREQAWIQAHPNPEAPQR